MTGSIVLSSVGKSFRRYPSRRSNTLKEALLHGWRWRNDPETRVHEALKNVSVSIAPGTAVGVLGRNGSGKSTFLRLVAGIYRPTVGTVEVEGCVSSLLSLGMGFHPDLTGRENVKIDGLVLGLSRRAISEQMDEIVRFAELEDVIDEPVRTYSTGMWMRLAFSIATSVDPDILLLDEVMAVGDASFAEKCRARMERFKDRGKSILIASHDMGLIESWCQTAVWLDRGELRYYGPSAEAVRRYCESIQVPSSAPTK